MTKGNNGISDWFKQNAWAIIIMMISMAIGWGMVITRINAMEAKLAQYPSEDYFELKFQVIEKDLSNLSILINQHVNGNK